MTDDELAAIRARANAATPGPWYGELSLWAEDADDGNITMEYLNREDKVTPQTEADLTFMARARTDIPLLVAEVERLRAENAALREIAQMVAKYADEYDSETGEYWLCQFCLATKEIYGHPEGVTHEPTCPVTRARALLAKE